MPKNWNVKKQNAEKLKWQKPRCQKTEMSKTKMPKSRNAKNFTEKRRNVKRNKLAKECSFCGFLTLCCFWKFKFLSFRIFDILVFYIVTPSRILIRKIFFFTKYLGNYFFNNIFYQIPSDITSLTTKAETTSPILRRRLKTTPSANTPFSCQTVEFRKWNTLPTIPASTPTSRTRMSTNAKPVELHHKKWNQRIVQ